ncbi:MAG: class I lanthipeptide [Deltaproteobacteria bacterium]|nr:class I lanthipeptide [Deltaproteobacteria bacterium]MCW5809174.1 class I lanthipeptide [Deltaproteobacteria bacterium]
MKKDRLARRLQLVRTTVRRLSPSELAAVHGGGPEAAALAGLPTGEIPTICTRYFTDSPNG